MRFLWPSGLWLLVVLPGLVAAYWAALRRKHAALRYSSIGIVRDAMGKMQRLRPHIPPLMFLAGVALCIIAIARPAAVVPTPVNERLIMLAIDVSLSMGEDDVKPTRLAAAQEAARAFIAAQPDDVLIGIVAFAAHGYLVQPPTADRQQAIAAVERLHLQHHTAIGIGVIAALRTIFPTDRLAEHWDIFGEGEPDLRAALRFTEERVQDMETTTKVSPGSYPHAAIVVLTDGRDTVGPSTEKASEFAAERGVRVYTVGFGKPQTMRSKNGELADEGLDEIALKHIAARTHGEYFPAATASELRAVYRRLPGRIVLRKTGTELSALLAAGAALFMLIAGWLSIAWWGGAARQ